MREFDDLCIEPVERLAPREISELRRREKVSQPIFARYLNVSKSNELQPPQMESSTKVAMAILGGIVLAGCAVPWSPYPSGWIMLVVAIYVGVPMLLMVVNDLSKLRQERMLVRHLEVFPPAAGDEEPWVDVNFAPLAADHIARWRRWFPWLMAILAMMVAGAFAGVPWFFIALLAIVGFGREFYLAVNVVEWLVAANWKNLLPAERLRIRICLLAIAAMAGTIAVGVVAIAYFLFFVRDVPLTWNVFASMGVYGLLVWPMGRTCVSCVRQAVRRMPPDERPSERAV